MLVLLIPRFLGRRQDRMLQQYEVLRMRFGLERRVAHSKWGRGIAERYSLSGRYRGYPVSLYEHYHKTDDGRVDWTSLVFEILFVAEFEMRIKFENTQGLAVFPKLEGAGVALEESSFTLEVSQSRALDSLRASGLVERLERFGGRETGGAISLSKGFLEYREVGSMESETMRLRFQEALLLLADLADALSLYASRLSPVGDGGAS